jgi:pimeloyl-ACP methyl ester carboxylesterase
MATFILISGAWHGAWCWEHVVPRLVLAGHRVLTPDLLGTGLDQTPPAQVTLDLWAEQIANLIQTEMEPCILVGHSRGGIVISQAAERVPDRIASLVFLAAGLVHNGDSLLAASNRLMPGFGSDVVTMNPDDGSYSANPGVVRSRLYNKTEPRCAAEAEERLRPDPAAPLTDTLELSRERFGAVPRAYIETLEDQVVPIELQRAMLKDMPCDPVISLASDHSPFYSDPQGLTDALLSVAARAIPYAKP